ncbi:MAG: pyridoxamine 5'-phosphate oxidase [Chitinophagaceae bacterium]|nr:pyridoxamine 5'-phosphate oxidase [Chitinophagaceae bacterium]MCW5925628.1 pyridoxamine 5'-phosphate oxidase [Chitinophagaceae bacterium]
MQPKDIAAIRQNYSRATLSEKDVDSHPVKQFEKWWNEALASEIDEVNAMTLATASSDGVPSARIVLLKGFSQAGFVFYTNYNSFKGRQLADNPKACLVFFWKELERQVRITGLVDRTSDEESDIYFRSRPEESRIGAITSPQSTVIESREWIDKKFRENRFRMQGSEIKRPDFWGGFIVKPVIMEFWQGGPGRLHDRIQYTLEEENNWKIERLAP